MNSIIVLLLLSASVASAQSATSKAADEGPHKKSICHVNDNGKDRPCTRSERKKMAAAPSWPEYPNVVIDKPKPSVKKKAQIQGICRGSTVPSAGCFPDMPKGVGDYVGETDSMKSCGADEVCWYNNEGPCNPPSCSNAPIEAIMLKFQEEPKKECVSEKDACWSIGSCPPIAVCKKDAPPEAKPEGIFIILGPAMRHEITVKDYNPNAHITLKELDNFLKQYQTTCFLKIEGECWITIDPDPSAPVEKGASK